METLRRPVSPRDCDILGHMNVSAYIDVVSDAMFALQTAAGLDRATLARTQRSFVAAHIEADYKTEMLAGEVFTLHSHVVHIGTKSARFAHRMIRMSDAAVVFQAENISVFFDLEARRAVAIPDDLRHGLGRLREGHTDEA
jgi:acyl-CoA thioester hydrolase